MVVLADSGPTARVPTIVRRAKFGISYLVFGMLAIISLAATVAVWREGVPANSRTNHWAVRKIIAPGFAQESAQAKLALARDLEREFNRGVDIHDQVAQLDAQSWKRFQQNFGEMMEIWFLAKVDHYESIKDEERKQRFLEMQIGRIKSWPVFERDATPSSQDKDRLERLTEFMLTRYRKLPSSQQQRIQRFLVAIWLRNSQISQFIPGVF